MRQWRKGKFLYVEPNASFSSLFLFFPPSLLYFYIFPSFCLSEAQTEISDNQGPVISLTCFIIIGGRGRLLIRWDFLPPSIIAYFYLAQVGLLISSQKKKTSSSAYFSAALRLGSFFLIRPRWRVDAALCLFFSSFFFGAVSFLRRRSPDAVQVRPSWWVSVPSRKGEFISCSCESYISTIPHWAVWQRWNDGCHLSHGLKEVVGKGIWILSEVCVRTLNPP